MIMMINMIIITKMMTSMMIMNMIIMMMNMIIMHMMMTCSSPRSNPVLMQPYNIICMSRPSLRHKSFITLSSWRMSAS